MIAGKVVGAERVLTTLSNMHGAMGDAIGRTVAGFGLDVLNASKRNTPLKTGRLRRSIHLEMFRDAANFTGIVGTNVEYAGAIEHGLKGSLPVREFVRKQTQAWGHPIAPVLVTVRPFTRRVNRPARPFLEPALASVTPTLADRLRADLRNVPGVTS